MIHIQHIADSSVGIAPFFNEGTDGAEIHPRIVEAAPDSPSVAKSFADGFEKTDLAEVLAALDIDELDYSHVRASALESSRGRTGEHCV